VPEAKLLLANANANGDGEEPPDVRNVEDLEDFARRLRALGPKWVLVKGGHVPFRRDGAAATAPEQREMVVDILLGPDGGEVTRIETPYIESSNTHGTGCSLASAIAANLAGGMQVVDAVRAACRYIEAGIRTAPGYGRGHGPLNHFHSTYMLPFAPWVFFPVAPFTLIYAHGF
jgi:hydroxymethylpyrimidine kinase/phosphomethylpyrimidine kinase